MRVVETCEMESTGKNKTSQRSETNSKSVESNTNESSRSISSSKRDLKVAPLASNPSSTGSDESTPFSTQWRDIVVTSIMFYLMTTVSGSMYMGGWSYMMQLDPTTPLGYAGYLMCSHRVGRALGTAAFAYYAFVSQNFRRSLLAGRVLSTISCVLYLTIEFFPVGLRFFVILLTFLLNALGEGSSCVIRSYVPLISTTKDRQTAYSVVSGANMLSIISGPAVQIICMGLSTSGISLGMRSLKLSLFTGPIWISLLLNILAIYVSICHFRDPKKTSMEPISEKGSLKTTLRQMLKQFALLDKLLISVCFVEKSVTSVAFVVLITMLSPFIVTTFNIAPEMTVKMVSFGQGGSGIISLITVALFVFTRLGKKFKGSVLFPFSLACFLLMYASSYPVLPFTGVALTPKNETSAPYGCESKQYAWCEHESIVKPHIWLPIVILVMGVAIPISLIAFDTIYSHVLGGIDQNLLQGAIIIIDDIASAIAPVVAACSFAYLGPAFWLIFALIMALGLLLWVPVYPRLKKMNI